MLLVLVVADVIAFALTIHAQLTYSPGPNGPSDTTLGQLMGWILSFGLLAAIGVILFLVRYERRMQGTSAPSRSHNVPRSQR